MCHRQAAHERHRSIMEITGGLPAGVVAKPKKSVKKKTALALLDDPSAIATASSPLLHAKAMQQEYLAEAQAAQSFAVQVSAYHLSSEIAEFMSQHNRDMTKWYHAIHELIQDDVDDQDVYEGEIYQPVLPLQEAFRKHSITAKALVTTIKKGAKKIKQADDAAD